jgi:hypothetical protein
MDFKDIIKQIAPIAGSLIGGPLAGFAIKQIGDAIGMSSPTVERITAAIQTGSLTPEQVSAIRVADDALKIRLAELNIDHEKIEAETERAYLADTQNARSAHSGDRGVFWLGVAVLVTMLLDMGCTFWLIYAILTGGLQIKDLGIVAAVFGILGTLNGYVAANAQQVLSYYFGSSRGSNDKSRDMADAIKTLGAAAKTV